MSSGKSITVEGYGESVSLPHEHGFLFRATAALVEQRKVANINVTEYLYISLEKGLAFRHDKRDYHVRKDGRGDTNERVDSSI